MNIFIDIESIPGNERPALSDIKVPVNYRDFEKIAAYQKEHQEDEYRKQAFDSMAGKIICIGYAADEDIPVCRCGEDEEDTLAQFACDLSTLQGQYREPITFIGWNVLAFDLGYLWRKAIKYGLVGIRNAINRDKYKGNHLDLMTVWATDYKDYRKMDDVAKFLGIPGKQNGMDGSKVYDAHLEGRMDDIVEYCRQDVEITRSIYRRIYE